MMIKTGPLPVIPKLNFLFRNKEAKVSQSIIRFFIALQIILSLDFGFSKHSTLRQKWFIKTLTLMQCALISTTCIVFFCVYLETLPAAWYSIFCLEYVMYVVVLVFSDSEKTFSVLHKDLSSFDSVIGIDSDSYNLDVSMLIACLSVVVFRVSQSCFFCYFNPDSCLTIPIIRVIYFIPLLCIDMVQVVYFYTFYFVYRRIKHLTKIVKGSRNITYCHYLYKTIVEATEKVKDTFDGVFLVSLLFKPPEYMASIFLTLKQITTGNNLSKTFSIGSYLTTTQSLIVIFAPAFSAGLLTAEVQKMKLVLHDRLYLEREQNHAKDMERLISYIDARPMQFTIWKIIPLDWRLPFIVLNLSTTYLIVLIQFAHLY